MIQIKNLRNEKPRAHDPVDVRIDRASILGNPYRIGVHGDREKVCELYEQRFLSIAKKYGRGFGLTGIEKSFIRELKRLEELYEVFDELNLFCWCAPKRCHAETIKAYLNGELF